MLIPERIRLWREEAAVLRSNGFLRAAASKERMADEIEADYAETDSALVNLRRAVELSGYTRGHLRRKLAEGRLENHGTKAEPLMRANDLPRKPARRAVGTPAPAPAASPTRRDLMREVLRPKPPPTTRATRQHRPARSK